MNNNEINVLKSIRDFCFYYHCHEHKCIFFIDDNIGCMFQSYKRPLSWPTEKIQEKDDTVNILIKIKEYCKEHYITNNCNNCKFLGVHQDRCGFYDIDNEIYTPDDWEFNDIPPDKIFYK